MRLLKTEVLTKSGLRLIVFEMIQFKLNHKTQCVLIIIVGLIIAFIADKLDTPINFKKQYMGLIIYPMIIVSVSLVIFGIKEFFSKPKY